MTDIIIRFFWLLDLCYGVIFLLKQMGRFILPSNVVCISNMDSYCNIPVP